VFENREIEAKKDEMTEELRKLHKEELRNMYFSPSTFRMIKSMRVRWMGHVARKRERRNAYMLSE
jgi:hypothetical protein